MKKHFGHTKRPFSAKRNYADYDERDYDKEEYEWEGGESEEHYSADEYGAEAHGEEGEEVEYYESEEYSDEGMEADDEEAGYYESEEYAEEYAEDGIEYVEEETEYAEDGIEYVEEETEYAEDEIEYAEEETEYAEDGIEYAEEETEYAEDGIEYAEEETEYAEDEEYDSADEYGAEAHGEESEEIEYYESEEYSDEGMEADDEGAGYCESQGYSQEGMAQEGYYETGGYTEEGIFGESFYESEEDPEEYTEEYAEKYTEEYTGEYAKEYADEYTRSDSEEDSEEDFYTAIDFDAEDTTAPSRREGRPSGKEGFMAKLGRILGNMDAMDRVMAVTGVGVLVLAVVVGVMFFNARTVERQVADFSGVGKELEGITVIGERGIAAVANAESARLNAAVIPEPEPEPTEEPKKDYDEKDYARQVIVEPDFTSIQKDLKIKFINEKTNKLVANVPFSVSIVDPDGGTSIWSDDDMDGIITKKDLKPGKYKVTMEALTDAKYANYTLSSLTRTVEVKKEIVYNKVDVANEVKTEKEVDASKEDTKKNETTVESSLTDTVAWVESKVLEAVYNEVSKSTIPDPLTIVMYGGVRSALLTLVEETNPDALPGNSQMPPAGDPGAGVSEPSGPDSQPGDTPDPGSSESTNPSGSTESPTPEPSVPTESPTPEPPASTESPTAEPTASPTPGPTASPTPEPTAPPTPTPGPTQSPTPSPSPSPSPSPAPAKGTLTVNSASLAGVVGAVLQAKAVPSGFTEGRELVYAASSSAEAVAKATVDAAGNVSVTAVAAGTAVITVTANYKDGDPATAATAAITVVVGGKKAMTLSSTAVTVYLGVPVTIKAEIANALSADSAVTAVSSDGNVAAATVDKRSVTITGVTLGTATVTVKFMENNEEVSASCTVTVKPHPTQDKSSLLKDKDGAQLYVLENNVYREAVYADYYTAEKFFLKGAAKYTGWQTIGDKVYYFTAEGKAVTGEQVIQGAKYNFASDGSLVVGSGILGIDVSKWNGNINWEAVKNSGISYVIIRCGYRGSAQGVLIEDPKFQANIKGAQAAGLKVGIYFFSQAVDEVEAVEEASMVLGQIKGYTISYPVFIDVEASGGRGDAIDKATRTAVCKAFCQTIQNGGYTAGIYSNKFWLENKIDTGSLGAYKIWLAQYAAAPTYAGRYDLWQYRSTGSVSGISGNVDMNISYLGY